MQSVLEKQIKYQMHKREKSINAGEKKYFAHGPMLQAFQKVLG